MKKRLIWLIVLVGLILGSCISIHKMPSGSMNGHRMQMYGVDSSIRTMNDSAWRHVNDNAPIHRRRGPALIEPWMLDESYLNDTIVNDGWH